MESLLKEIVENTSPKNSMQIIVSGDKTNIQTKFNPPLNLKRDSEIALVNLETYYSFPNINSENNLFKYSEDNGQNWVLVYIPTGCYGLKDLNKLIQSNLEEPDAIELLANYNTLRTILKLKKHCQVDFQPDNSLRTVLGFDKKIYNGYNESEKIVNILNINTILVNIDIISGSYVNGTMEPTIYSFFPDANPGEKIIENPKSLVYLPITLNTIYSINTTLTDQDGKSIDLRGEEITIRFHLREK